MADRGAFLDDLIKGAATEEQRTHLLSLKERLNKYEDSESRHKRKSKEFRCRKAFVCADCGRASFGTRSKSIGRWYSYCASCIARADAGSKPPGQWARDRDAGPFEELAEKYDSFSFELNSGNRHDVVRGRNYDVRTGKRFDDLLPLLRRIITYFDVNKLEGCEQQSKVMADIGCAHASVGNTCPGVFRVGEDSFVIAGSAYDPETDKLYEPSWEQVASVCTDLWWYSIVDGDEFKRRGCEGHYSDAQTVKVRPGVYRFTHKLWREDVEGPNIFSTVEWVRDPDVVRDFAAEYSAKNFTAGQVIANSIKKWPTLYSNDADGIRQAADHIFCTIGGGGDWHKNGFVQYDPDMKPDDPSVDIPKFSGSYTWYPLNEEYSALCLAADGKINLNPSFAALAINVAECIVAHGSKEFAGHPDLTKHNVEIAKRCLEQLRLRYPA